MPGVGFLPLAGLRAHIVSPLQKPPEKLTTVPCWEVPTGLSVHFDVQTLKAVSCQVPWLPSLQVLCVTTPHTQHTTYPGLPRPHFIAPFLFQALVKHLLPFTVSS